MAATKVTRSSRSSARTANEIDASRVTDSKQDTENSSRKRKRDAVKSSDVKQEDIKQEDSATPTRRSPRKAAKLEDDDTPKKARRTPAKRIKGPNGEYTVQPPSNWERIYEVTAAMRKRVEAPVDTMGCESLADETRSPKDQRLQTLIALMLSSQTKDTVTAVAIANLQQNLPGGFCLDGLLKVEPEKLNELISKVGFHNNKTKFIKQTAEILRDKFDGDIPNTIEGLTSLPGVGPKMSYLTLSAAWGRHEGIGVDVHVHRITNLWKWHTTSTPEQTRAQLEAWLPKDKWHDINHLLVGFGQTYCPPVGRKCDNCDLSSLKLCPSAVKGRPAVKKRTFKDIPMDVENDGDLQIAKVKIEQDDFAVAWNIETARSGIVDLSDKIGGELPDIKTIVADEPDVNYIDMVKE